MSAKINASRRKAFLAALTASGNQTLSAERAKVSRSWVQLHRATDAGFDAACRRAIEEAKAVLRQAQHERSMDEAQPLRGAASAAPQGERSSMKPPTGWGFLDGEELVVKGTGGASFAGAPAKTRRVQIARARVRQWSPRVEERFLAALTATCNVKAGCAEVGLTAASAYNHRQRWPGFARRWDAAIEVGYTQLECGLIEAGANLFSGEGLGEVAPLRGMTVGHAIHLLHMHKHAARGLGKRPGLPPQIEPDIEVVRAEILRRVAVLQRRDRS